jgi:hypothetical protein
MINVVGIFAPDMASRDLAAWTGTGMNRKDAKAQRRYCARTRARDPLRLCGSAVFFAAAAACEGAAELPLKSYPPLEGGWL